MKDIEKMTIQQLRDEFLQLRFDDEQFAEQYDNTTEDFQSWLYDCCLQTENAQEVKG